MFAKVWRVLALLAVLSVSSGLAPANAITIDYEAVDAADLVAGEDLWQYRYRASGNFTSGTGFSIVFDAATNGELEAFPVAPNGDWMIAATPPFAGADGLYTAIAQTDGASLADLFVVAFVWLGPGQPGMQSFETFDEQFNITGGGRTTAKGAPAPGVPEPGSLLLASAALALLARKRCIR